MPTSQSSFPAKRSRKKEASQEENFGSHLQPQAPELEAAVLGSIMVEHDAFAEVCDIITSEETFYEPRNQKVYAAIMRLYTNDHPIDMLSVTEELRRHGELEQVGGPYYIAKLCDTVSGSFNVEYYAAIIQQKYIFRQIISYSSRLQTQAFDETTELKQLIEDAEAGLFSITQFSRKKDYTQIDPVVQEAYKMVHDAASRPDGLNGIASGFTALDKETGGWQKSDLIIIAARPAMGKTAFALSMAKNISIDQEIPMAFFSLEMSNIQLINRMVCNLCSIPADKLRNGQLEPYEWGQLDSNIKKMKGKPLFLDDTSGLSIYDLRSKARRLVKEHNVQIIMIDYLQLMTAAQSRPGNRQEEVSTISRSLKGLAKELNIPIIALSQLNRNLEQRGEDKSNGNGASKRPQLSDLRESGAIEQDADIVCMIHRPEYYKIYKDEKGNDIRGLAEIIIAKHRNGAVGTKYLRFVGVYTRFENSEDNMDVEQAYRIKDGTREFASSMNTVESEEIPPYAPPFNDNTPDDPLGHAIQGDF